jgi:hypothetical protein
MGTGLRSTAGKVALCALLACSSPDDGAKDAADSGSSMAGPAPSAGNRASAPGGPDAGGGPATSDAGGSSTFDAGPGDGGSAPGCALPPPIDQGVTWQRTLHVTTSGDDGTGDGSEASPFSSIERALGEAQPGTRVLVHAGSYGPFSADGLTGEPGRPIAIVADGEVVLQAGGAQAIIGMSDPAYVVIEGFTLMGATVHGMNIDDGGSHDTPAHHLVLRNLTIPGAGSGGNNDCIKLSGVDDFWVLGSDVAGCNQGEIIDMVGCHRGVIAGNYFHDTIMNGVQTKGGSADTLIHGNRFEGIPGRAVNAGGSTGLEFLRPLDAPHEAARIAVFANVFVRNGAMGGAAVAYVGCDGCVAAHNTVIEPRTWVARILQESTDARFVPSRNGLFVNNLIVLQSSDLRGELVNVGPDTAPETFVFGSNLWFASDQGAGWAPNLGASVPAESDSIVQQDPQLTDLARGDFHLGSGSPARGAARTLDDPPLSDFDGNCYAEPAALGAFEH